MAPKLTTLALLLGALPALAADPAVDPAREIQALKDRIAALEKAQKAQAAKDGAGATGAVAQDLAETKAEVARVAVKTEALEDSRDEAGLKGLKISGYLDPVYLYNVNQKRAGFQFLVPIGVQPYGYDSSYFASAALDFLKETDSGVRWHLTLIPARSTGDIIGGANIVHEASVSVPIGSDTHFFAGQLPDWSGYEYVSPTLNKLITHNLLFDFTLPTAYTGGGFEHAFGKWDLKLGVANMNQPLRSVNEYVPMLVYRGDYSGGEFWGVGFAGAHGKKVNYRPYDDTGAPLAGVSQRDTWADLFEVDGWYARGDLTLNAHVGFGHQNDAAIALSATGQLQDAMWAGASVLAAYKLTPRLEGIVRADYLWNRQHGGGFLDYTAADPYNGIGPDPAGDPDVGTDRYAVSTGLGFTFNENTVFKLEYRFDGARFPVFVKTNGDYVKTNSQIATSVVVSF